MALHPTPTILRHGSISADALRDATGENFGETLTPAQITAPGQMQSHYAPHVPVRLNATAPQAGESYLGFGPMHCTRNLSASGNLGEAATNLFAALHDLDQLGQPIAIAPIPMAGVGIAINDRLNRAAAPRGRG